MTEQGNGRRGQGGNGWLASTGLCKVIVKISLFFFTSEQNGKPLQGFK